MNLGTTEINTAKVGSSQVSKIMLGFIEVWPAGPNYILASPNNMTSNTHTLGTASASSSYSSTYAAYKAFDSSSSSGAWYTDLTTSGWLQFAFASTGEQIERYTMSSNASDPGNWAKSWTLQGSNTGAFSGEQVILDTQTNAPAWSDNEVRTYDIINSTSYKYYRLNITEDQDNSFFVGVAELELYSLA